MTLKEKARELYNKMYSTNSHPNSVKVRKEYAKDAALMAIEFARDQFNNYCCAEMNTVGSPDDHFDALKQEIEKL